MKNKRPPHSPFSQCAGCQAPGMLEILVTLDNVAIIIHSAAGCASTFIRLNEIYQSGRRKRNLPTYNAPCISTNLSELDMIMGIDEKLELAVKKACGRYHPEAVFIAASCGSGVTGMEIQDVIDRIQPQYEVPLITIVCELFRNNKWSSGFDGRKNGVLNKLIPKTDHRKNFYNIIDFTGSGFFEKYLCGMQKDFNHIRLYSSIDTIKKAAQAKGSIVFGSSPFANYIAGELMNRWQVLVIRHIPNPIGMKDTKECLRQLGSLAGEEQRFMSRLEEDRLIYEKIIDKNKVKLQNLSCLSLMGGRGTVDVDGLFEDLDLKMIRLEESKIGFAGGYQLIALIKHINPDILIFKNQSLSGWGSDLGVPSVQIPSSKEFFGYEGLFELSRDLVRTINSDRLMFQLPYRKF